MIVGSVPPEGLWLSCDHTFGSVANFCVFREGDGNWVEQYSGLFCILNANREILTWKLTKNLHFESVAIQISNKSTTTVNQGG